MLFFCEVFFLIPAVCCIYFSYILKVPFNKDDTQGVAYVWIGNRADPEEGKLTEEIAEEMYGVCIM